MDRQDFPPSVGITSDGKDLVHLNNGLGISILHRFLVSAEKGSVYLVYVETQKARLLSKPSKNLILERSYCRPSEVIESLASAFVD